VPQVGAARARLSDADWQAVVLNWMNTSSSIVMLAGTSQWVEWELSHVIETSNATKLMLLFPLTQGGRKGRDDHLARINLGKSAFAGSMWAQTWERIANPEGVLAARFHASGANPRRTGVSHRHSVGRTHFASHDADGGAGEPPPAGDDSDRSLKKSGPGG
jgi:hypothetical protein